MKKIALIIGALLIIIIIGGAMIWFGGSLKPKTPYLILISPNGGEVLELRKDYSIRWKSFGIEKINISLWKEGKFYRTIAENIPAAQEKYVWGVPPDLPLDANYQIKIDGSPTTYDMSDSFFAIGGCAIAITSPDGGEFWPINSTQKIRWSTEGIPQAKGNLYLVDYSQQPPATFLIASKIEIADLNYIWKIPPTISVGNLYKVKIEIPELNLESESFDYFAITKSPFVHLLYPSPEGEWGAPYEWKIGEKYKILWESEGVEKINIDLCDYLKPEECINLAENIPANQGVFDWTVSPPSNITPKSYYFIQLSEVVPPGGKGIQEKSGSIALIKVGLMYINLISPNGGEKWQRGKTYDILFSAKTIAGVYTIELIDYRSSPPQKYILVSRIEGGGDVTKYSWAIPENLPVGTKYKIRVAVAPTSAEGMFDESDDYFSIIE